MEKKSVKIMTKFDSHRLGYKPKEGESHWTRSCQNSGNKKRQPLQINESIDKLLKLGYEFNNKTNFYEKKINRNKKQITLRAVGLENPTNNSITYYACDEKENKDYIYVGFLSKSKNPNKLCEPCCFKKDQYNSVNKEKDNLFKKCIGMKVNDDNSYQKKYKSEKIYILQDTNKIQQDRYGFLPDLLDSYINKSLNNVLKIKNHYLEYTNESYFFKYGVKNDLNPFLQCLCIIYDINYNDLLNKLINLLKSNDNILTYLNNGDTKTIFKNNESFINLLKNNNNIDYNFLIDLVSIPNLLSKNGINFYIFNKINLFIDQNLEKKKVLDNYQLLCLNVENNIYLDDELRDNIILLKDNNIFYPIIEIRKNKNTSINKKFKNNDKAIKLIKSYLDVNCKQILINLNINIAKKIDKI